jgi:hypothetical protein
MDMFAAYPFNIATNDCMTHNSRSFQPGDFLPFFPHSRNSRNPKVRYATTEDVSASLSYSISI